MDKDHIMKEEDRKENAMEAQRIFVENLPKPKKWWIEYIPLFIACIAVFTSIYSANLSRQATDLARRDIIATHRPYVYVSSRKNDNGTMDVKSVLLHSLNASAKITNQEFSYVVVKTKKNGEEEVAETIPWTSLPTSGTLYPSEKLTNQVYEPYDF